MSFCRIRLGQSRTRPRIQRPHGLASVSRLLKAYWSVVHGYSTCQAGEDDGRLATVDLAAPPPTLELSPPATPEPDWDAAAGTSDSAKPHAMSSLNLLRRARAQLVSSKAVGLQQLATVTAPRAGEGAPV